MMHDDDDDFDLAAVERERKREAYVAKLESELASMKRARRGAGRPARGGDGGGAREGDDDDDDDARGSADRERRVARGAPRGRRVRRPRRRCGR